MKVTSLNVLLLSGFVLTDQHYCTNHQPCRNGGTCINDANKNFTCACSVGYTGQRCENVVCYNSICQNGGKCQVKWSYPLFLHKTSFLNEPFDIIGNFLMCIILPRSVIQVLWPYFRELRKIMLRAFVPMVSMVNIVNTRNIIVKTQIAPMLARVLKKQTVYVVCV